MAHLALAFVLINVLLETLNFTTGADAAQLSVDQQVSVEQGTSSNIRGNGESLEFRVHGRMLGDASGPPALYLAMKANATSAKCSAASNKS